LGYSALLRGGQSLGGPSFYALKSSEPPKAEMTTPMARYFTREEVATHPYQAGFL
jgi:hypothetical protein